MADREHTWQAGPLRIRVTLPPDESAPKERLSVERIVEVAMELMARVGYDGVTMRSLAKELGTGPASLYAHVANREELDQLVLDRITTQVEVPEPDAGRWQEQVKEVLRETLRLYRAHPGSARAAVGMVPTGRGVMRTMEGLLAILDAGGIGPQAAAWFLDVSAMYVSAVGIEESVWTARTSSTPSGEKPDHPALDEQLSALYASLPTDRFPHVVALASTLVQGDGDDRFEFGLDLLVSGLAAVSDRYR